MCKNCHLFSPPALSVGGYDLKHDLKQLLENEACIILNDSIYLHQFRGKFTGLLLH